MVCISQERTAVSSPYSHTSSHRERHENGRESPTSNANARYASLGVRHPRFLSRCGVRTVLRLPCHPYDGNKFRRVPSMRHITNCCILYRISTRCVIHCERRVLLAMCRLVICVRAVLSSCLPRHWTRSETPGRDAALLITCRERIVGHIVWCTWFELRGSTIYHAQLSQAWSSE